MKKFLMCVHSIFNISRFFSAVVAGVFLLILASTASADIINNDFSLYATYGDYAGQTFNGTYSYDDADLAYGDAPLLSFSTDFPFISSLTLDDIALAGGFISANDNLGLFAVYVPGDTGTVGAFIFAYDWFTYGETLEPGSSFINYGGGNIYYGDTSPVPEPATMLLFSFGLVGLAGFRRKFRKN
jgi:hypothetical protein